MRVLALAAVALLLAPLAGCLERAESAAVAPQAIEPAPAPYVRIVEGESSAEVATPLVFVNSRTARLEIPEAGPTKAVMVATWSAATALGEELTVYVYPDPASYPGHEVTGESPLTFEVPLELIPEEGPLHAYGYSTYGVEANHRVAFQLTLHYG